MADANMGSLWMSLNLKDATSSALKKIQQEFSGTDKKAKEVQETIKEIQKGLKSDNSAAFGGAISKLSELLKKSKTDAKDLSVVLDSLGKKRGGLNELFSGKVNASNVSRYLNIVNQLCAAIEGLDKARSKETKDSYYNISQASSYLSEVRAVNDELKVLRSLLANNPTGHADGIKSLIKDYETLRTAMLAAFNDTSWKNADFGAKRAEYMQKALAFANELSTKTEKVGNAEAAGAKAATEALKKEEQQASKTAEALEKVAAEANKQGAPREAAQEKAFNAELDKMVVKAQAAEDAVSKLNFRLNEILNAFRGSSSKTLKIDEAGKDGRQYVDVLKQINAAVEKIKGSEGKDGPANAKWVIGMVDNALKYLGLLQEIDLKLKEINNLKSINPNVDSKKIKEALNTIQHFKEELVALENGKFLTGVDKANVLQQYADVWRKTVKSVNEVTKGFEKKNQLSDFASGIDKANASISNVWTRIKDLQSLMAEGKSKGYDTSMLFDNIAALSNRLSELYRITGKDSKRMTDEVYMKGLYSNIAADMTLAKNAMRDYGREKAKVIAANKETDKQKSKLEAEINATRTLIDLQKQLNHTANMAENGVGMKGLTLGADISNLSSKIGELRSFINSLNSVDPAFMGIDGNKAFADYKSEAKSLTYALQEAIQAQRELNAAKNAVNKKAERDQSKADAKAKREDAAAEKQRWREVKNSEARYDSLGNKVRQLRIEFSKGLTIGADVSKAEEEIHRLIFAMRQLMRIRDGLASSEWKNFLGELGGIGGGHDTTLANRALQDQRAINSETQKGVELERKRQQEVAKTAASVRNDLAKGLEQANRAAGQMGSTLQDIKSLFLQGGLVYGAWQFANSIITTGGEMEKQHIALQSILGDMQNANTMFNQIKDLALNSPFTFSELNRDVKQLAAYGVEYDQLYDTTKRLADMSSGLGVSFDRIALAFGQVQARGWLDGKELRQIAYAGIPLLNKLSELYSKREGKTVTSSEIKTRISKREVSFDDVKDIFWEMTNEGGQFYNMQQTLSETLLGRYNKLKDAWEIMLADFADGKGAIGGTFKFILDQVTSLVQAMHSLSLSVGTIFAGYAIKRGLAGNVASAFLSNKASMASNIQSRLLQGQQISAMEQKILATKNKITNADLRALNSARVLTTQQLNQLRLSGQITAEQYRTFRGIVRRRTGEQGVTAQLRASLAAMRRINATTLKRGLNHIWLSFATSAQAAFLQIGTGIRALGASIWSAIGGLPGLIITAATFGITSLISSYQELSRKVSQTQDELADRNVQIAKFLQENNIGAAIGSGDAKKVDNMIEAYKEKLKELAPYSYKNMIMSAEERQSHAGRLKYLEAELKLIKQANETAKSELSNRGYYSGLEENIKKSAGHLDVRMQLRAQAMMPGASEGEKALYKNERAYSDYIQKLKDKIYKAFGDISKDERMREAANQAMSSIFSELGVPEDRANMIRASVLQAFGCGSKSGWLQDEVSSSMRRLIDAAFPEIAAKIKASIPLTEAEKAKVRELMKDAKQGLITQYPELETTLKNLLADSNFQAVIHLVYDSGDKYNDVQSELTGRIPTALNEESKKKYIKRAEEYGKDNDWASAKSQANSNIKKAKENWQAAVEAGAKNAEQLKQEYEEEKAIAQTLLRLKEESDKTKDTTKNTPKGKKEDTALKALQERLSSLKSARQMFQKYQTTMSDEAAKNRTLESFPEVVGLSLDNYQEAVKKLLEGFSINTTERKKFQTSVYREVAEWIFEEKDKKEFEAKAATFSEAMSRLASQWDNYKSLLEKTGSKDFAGNAFTDGHLVNGKAQALMDAYKKNYGKDFDIAAALAMTDGQAKATLKGPNEYESWKQIVDLLRNNYVTALNDGAEAISQTLSLAQKLDAVTQKYNKKRTEAGDNQDLIDRYNYLEKNEKSGILLEDLKSQINWEGVFGNLDNYTKKELKKIRTQLRELVKGGFLDGMTPEDLKTFYDGAQKLDKAINGGSFGGLTDLIKELTAASQEYDAAVEQYKKDVEAFGKNSWQADVSRRAMNVAENRKIQAQNDVKDKKWTKANNVIQLANMFTTLGRSDGSGSTLLQNAGGWAQSISTMAGGGKKNSEKLGSIVGFFAGLTEAISEKGLGGFVGDAFEDIGGAVNSIFKDLFGLDLGFTGADYDDYNDAKAEYDNLVNVWDTLISKKKQYMSEHWGTEAESASKEAMALLQSEIEQTKEVAKIRLGSGASLGSHSLQYRMWQGSYDYNGTNWKDVAGEISRQYGVQFDSMEDMLNMAPDVLEKIKTDYSGLWAHMDGDFKDYLDKLIEYGDQVDEMTESLTEKLTGNKFSDLVSSWGDAMATMANYSDNLIEHFESNLKKTILNSMVENIYGKKIKALLAKTQSYAENGDKITSSEGDVVSEYTGAEYAEIISSTEDLSKEIEATRDYLKQVYGWSDDSSSSSTNTIKGITEETADIIASYLNAIRLDVSVNRENVKLIADAVADIPEMSAIAQSQLTQLNAIAQNTLRNADAADEIVSLFKAVTNGTKKVYMN